MGKTDAQIAAEQKFLVRTLLVVILLMISIILVTLNWNSWFGKDVPPTPGTSPNGNLDIDENAGDWNGANVETVLIVK